MTSRMIEIIEKVDITWNKDKIIRHLYVCLAPFFQRDLDFFMADEVTQLNMYKQGFKEEFHLVVCKTICERYSKIYGNFGIKSLVVTTNKKIVPHYGLLVEGDFGWYYIDPLKDLFSNQLGIKTAFFGVTPVKYSDIKDRYPFLIDLPYGYVENLDRELGLLYKGIYMDTFFEKLHDEIASNRVFNFFDVSKNNQYIIMKKKLEFMEQYLINLGNIPGLYERNTYYDFLIYNCFNKRERKFISSNLVSCAGSYNIEINLIPKNLDEEELIYHEIEEKGKYYLKKIN